MSTIFVFAGCLEKIVIWLTRLLPQVQGRSYVYASKHLLPWKTVSSQIKSKAKKVNKGYLKNGVFNLF